MPEVQTIITDLRKVLPGLKITGFWSDIPSFRDIKKEVVGKKIMKLELRGKNILIVLSENKILLIHQRMTGHLLYGKWKFQGKELKSLISGPLLKDPQNRFIHLILGLSNGKQLALSDLRKFAKVLVWPADKLDQLPEIAKLGPEPLEPSFSLGKFREILKKKSGKIKVVLMNQEVISGIGNIYSDEILWEAGIHPLARAERLDDNDLKMIFHAIKKVLNKAIKAHTLMLVDMGLSFHEALEQLKTAFRGKNTKLGKLVICSKMGTEKSKIYYDYIENLMGAEIYPPFCIIIPSELHFIEGEALNLVSEKTR